jgi:hypothetical protein
MGNRNVCMVPGLPLWSYEFRRDSLVAVLSRKDFEIQLLFRVLTDTALRKALLDFPKETVQTELGAALPEKMSVQVVEETADTSYLVIPSNSTDFATNENSGWYSRVVPGDAAQRAAELRSTLLDESASRDLCVRAMTDNSFRECLLADPKRAITNEYGIRLPDELKVIVVEETPEKIYLVIPFVQDDLLGYASREIPNTAWFSALPGAGARAAWIEVAIGSTTGQYPGGPRGC